MTVMEIQDRILELPPHERLALAQIIFESIDGDNGSLPEWQRKMLDERLASSVNEKGQDWEEVRTELWPNES